MFLLIGGRQGDSHITGSPGVRRQGGYSRAGHLQVLNAHLDDLLRARHGDLVVVGGVGKVAQAGQRLQLDQGVRPVALGDHLQQLCGGRGGRSVRGDPSAHRVGCCQLGATLLAETLHLAVAYGVM